eukprot:12958745-Alexandrium_andersonii.AAC.1
MAARVNSCTRSCTAERRCSEQLRARSLMKAGCTEVNHDWLHLEQCRGDAGGPIELRGALAGKE